MLNQQLLQQQARLMGQPTDTKKEKFDDSYKQFRQSKLYKTYTTPAGIGGTIFFDMMMRAPEFRTKVLDQVGKAIGKADLSGAFANTMGQIGGASIGLGGAYLGIKGLSNVGRTQRMMQEKQYSKELGAVGKGSRMFDNLMKMQALSYTLPLGLGMMAGKGSAWAGPSLFKAVGSATGMGTVGAGLGLAGVGIGLALAKSFRLSRIRASKQAPGNLTQQYSVSKQFDPYIARAQQKGELKTGEVIMISLLQRIEESTSVLGLMASNMQFLEDSKSKDVDTGIKQYEDYKEPELPGFFSRIFDRMEKGISKVGIKFNPFEQLMTFITTGKMPGTVLKDLEDAYGSDKISNYEKQQSLKYGISTPDVRLLHLSSSRVLGMAQTFEAKQIALLAAILDVSIFDAKTNLTMMRAQGIDKQAFANLNLENQTLMGKLFNFFLDGNWIDMPKEIGKAITDLPVINTLWNVAKLPFDIYGGVSNFVRETRKKHQEAKVTAKQRNLDDQTSGIYSLMQNEDAFEKAIYGNAYKTETEKAYNFMGRGLPVIMGRLETIAQKQLFIQTATLQILEKTSGVTVDKSEMNKIEDLVWDPITNRFSTPKQIKDFKDKLKLEYVKEHLGENSFWGNFKEAIGISRPDTEEDKKGRALNVLSETLGVNIKDMEKELYKEKTKGSDLFEYTETPIRTKKQEKLQRYFDVVQGKSKFKKIGTPTLISDQLQLYKDTAPFDKVISDKFSPKVFQQTITSDSVQIAILPGTNVDFFYPDTRSGSGSIPQGPAFATGGKTRAKDFIVGEGGSEKVSIDNKDNVTITPLDPKKTQEYLDSRPEVVYLAGIYKYIKKFVQEFSFVNMSHAFTGIISDQPSVKEQHEKMKEEGKEEKRDEEQEKQTQALSDMKDILEEQNKQITKLSKGTKKKENWWAKAGILAIAGAALMTIFSPGSRIPMAVGALAGLKIGGIPGAIVGGLIGGGLGMLWNLMGDETKDKIKGIGKSILDKVGEFIATNPILGLSATTLIGMKFGIIGGLPGMVAGGAIGAALGLIAPMLSETLSPQDKKKFYMDIANVLADNEWKAVGAGALSGLMLMAPFGPKAMLVGAFTGAALGAIAPSLMRAHAQNIDPETGELDKLGTIHDMTGELRDPTNTTGYAATIGLGPIPRVANELLYFGSKIGKFFRGDKSDQDGFATGGKVIPLDGQDYSFNVGEQGAEQVTIKDGVISIKPNPGANESWNMIPSSNTPKKMSKQVVQSPPLTNLVNTELSKLNTYDNKLIASTAVEGFKEGARYGTMEALYGATYGAIIGNVLGQDLQPHKVQKIQKQISSGSTTEQKSEQKKVSQVDKLKEDLKKYNVLSESEWMLNNFDIASGAYNPDDYQIYLMKHGVFKDTDGRIKKLPTNLEKRRQKQGDPWKDYNHNQIDSSTTDESDETDDLLTNPLKLLGYFFKKLDERKKPKKYSAELHAFYRNPKQRIPLKKLFEYLQTGGLTDNRVYWVYDEKLGFTNIPVAVECVPLVEKRSNDVKNMKKAAFDLLHYMFQAKTGINVSPETIQPVQYHEIITPNSFRIICCWNVMLGDVREKGSKHRSPLDQDADASAVTQSYNRTETERLHSSNPAIQIQQDSLPVTGSPDMEDNSYISNQSSFPLRTETERLHSNQNINPAIGNIEQLSETTGTGLTQDSVGVVSPVDSNYITSPFGSRPNNKGMSDPHGGLDLRARLGEPIYAAMSGTVVRIGGQFGEVVLSHGNGLHTRYLHLSGFNVEKGQQVQAGEVIGYSGGTGPKGASHYTPHLHYEVLKDGMKVDPEQFLKTAGINLTGGKSETEAGGLFDSVSNAVSGITGSLTGSGGIGGLLNQSISGITGPLQDMSLIGQAENMLRGGISNFVDAKIGGLTNQAMGLIDMGTGIFTNPEQLLKTSISGLTGPLSDIGSPKELLNKTIGELLATTDNPEKLLGSSISQILGQVGETTKSIDGLPWLDDVGSKAQDTATGFMDNIFNGGSLGDMATNLTSGFTQNLGGSFGNMLNQGVNGLFNGGSLGDMATNLTSGFTQNLGGSLGNMLNQGVNGLFNGGSLGDIATNLTSGFDIFNNNLNNMMEDFNLTNITDKAQKVISESTSPMNSTTIPEVQPQITNNQLSEPPSTPMKSGETPLMPEGAIELQSTVENVLMGQIDNLFGLSRHQLRQHIVDYAYGRMIYSSRSIA